jgi:hypothetical protein
MAGTIQGDARMTTNGSSRPAIEFRLLGLLPLIFFAAHFLHYLKVGGLGDMLWICHVSSLLLAAGILFNRPLFIRVATCWMIIGLIIWALYLFAGGQWILTSLFVHVGGVIVGLLALRKVRTDRVSWLYAIAWFLLVQQVARMVAPPELNVNVAHRVYEGMDKYFSAYWQYWLASTVAVAISLWILGLLLWRIFPPRADHPALHG